MISIRLAKSTDAPELARINDLFNGEGSNTACAIEESLKQNQEEIVCVAVEGSELVGYCCGKKVITMRYHYESGDVTALFVMEEYRRQGIGRRLLAYIESEFHKHGVSHLHICTGIENTIAQTLYRSCGYEDTSEIILDKGTP
jgi:ribosomal protein S18 acetylase RimI-like enzyme